MKNAKKYKSLIVTGIILLIAVLGIVGYKAYEKSQVVEGEKNITVIVEDARNNYTEEFKHNTDAEFLGQALDEMKLIKTEDSEFGRFVVGVNEIEANMDNSEWWKFTINDVDSVTGVDGTPIKDGDTIKFSFTIGW